MVSHSEIIELPIETVWEHFINKIEHPENFVPGVSNVIIKEKTDDHVIRQMDIALPGGSKANVVEKITQAPFLVKFLILDHPVYTGYVDNLAEKISENKTKITYSLHWVNKQSGEPFNNSELAKNAVLKTIEFMMSSKRS